MKLKLITAPNVEPMTLTEAKLFLRVDGITENDLITELITIAREYCENYQNRAYITQTWELALDCFPAVDYIELPKGKLQSVTSVKYYDTTETETTFSSDNYHVDDYNVVGKVVLAYSEIWPTTTLRTTNGVIIRYVVGYGDNASDVSVRVKQAMYMLIAHWYENREATGQRFVPKEIDFAVSALLTQDRIVRF